MEFWQVQRKVGGLICPTIEYVQAPDYGAALREINAAIAAGNSGFGSGYSDVKRVNGFPSTFRGVPTRLATSRPCIGERPDRPCDSDCSRRVVAAAECNCSRSG